MLNLIKADLFRIFKSKGIYIVIILLIASACMSAYSLSPVSMGLNLGEEDNNKMYNLTDEQLNELYNTVSIEDTRDILLNYGDYSLDVAVVAKNNNLYYLFIAVIVFVIGSDFSNNTIKNTISTNISKRKYYFSKLVTALILGTLLIFLNAFFSHFANIILNGQSFVSPFTDVLLIIIKQLPLLYAMISILLMLNVIIRKAPLYNGITIPLVMTFQLVLTTAIKFLDLPNYIINYEWETALTKLSLSPDLTYLLQTLGFWAVVFAITVIIGYNNFKARDI